MNVKNKPYLRGHFHQAAFFTALGACSLLVHKGYKSSSFFAIFIYSLSLVSLLGISALYHRVDWSNVSSRMIMRRLDHAAIYFLIAGTITPICVIALHPISANRLLMYAWTVACVGIILSIFFTHKPKWLNVLLFLGAGFVMLPYLSEMAKGLGLLNLGLIIAGVITYILGAVAYAIKWPNFFPKVFGYHEVFHAFVIFGATSHFIVIHSLVGG